MNPLNLIQSNKDGDVAEPAPSWTRRSFLRSAGLATAGLSLTKSVLQPGAVFGAEFYAGSGEQSSDWIDWSATELAAAIRENKVSSTELVQAYYERIDQVNPKINAVVMMCRERAFSEAKAADEVLARGEISGALHGVPFTLKDSIETEGVITTAGTMGFKNYVPTQDATAAARLRKAGAVLLGKTNTPEFTLGGGTRGTYNDVYGQTNNPYNLAHTPRGSSGGAGAIVASSGSAFDIGSDFGGSIRSPAHACGVFGLKPTSGRVPRTGHWPGYGGMFDAYQQLGPLSRYVVDAGVILPIIAGPDYRDAAIHPAPLGDPGMVKLSELKVAFYINNQVMTPIPEIQKMVQSGAKLMEALGAEVVEDFHGGDPIGNKVRSALTNCDGGAWLQRLLDIAGTKEASVGLARRLGGPSLECSEITRLLEEQDALRSRMIHWFQQYDVILCPANAFPAPAHAKPVPSSAGYTSIYNITGWPAGVVRGGTSDEGLPLGIQIVGRPWREHVVLAVAAYLEKELKGWVRPMI